MSELPRVTIDGVEYEVRAGGRHSVGMSFHHHPEPHEEAKEATTEYRDGEKGVAYVLDRGLPRTQCQHHHHDPRCELRSAVLTPAD